MLDKLVVRIGRPLLSHPDRISGSVLFVVAILAWIEAIHLPFGSIRAPDAGFFPQALSALLFLVSIAILVHSFSRDLAAAEFSWKSWLVPLAAAGFVCYALILPSVGFVLSTIGIMLLVMRGLGRMPWKRALLIAVPTVLVSYFAFIKLCVPLPQGPLPF